MQTRTLVSTLALAACTLAPLASSAASLFGRDANTPTPTAKVAKVKTVKLTLKNRTADAMTIVVNSQPMTLAANSEVNVRAAEGSNIFAADGTTVKLHVTRDLSDNTVSFR